MLDMTCNEQCLETLGLTCCCMQEEDRKRHLLRMWITPEKGWPLPDQFADRYHTVEIGNRGGIFCPDQTPYVPLDPFQ